MHRKMNMDCFKKLIFDTQSSTFLCLPEELHRCRAIRNSALFSKYRSCDRQTCSYPYISVWFIELF